MKLNFIFFVLFVLLFLSCSKQNQSTSSEQPESTNATGVAGTNYYVSVNGNDSNTGTTTRNPWKTIAKVNNWNFQSGDKIYFRRGQSWAETLIPTSSGSNSSRIVYDAYGAGAPPKIKGAINQSGIAWTNQRSYLTFRNLTLEGCGKPSGNNQGGINVYNNSGNPSEGIIIENMTIKNSRTWNIYMSGVDNLVIRNNSISNAQNEHGIYLDGSLGLHGVIVENNEIFDNAQMGIQLNSNDIEFVSDAIIRYNRIYDCGFGGINNIGADGLLCHNNLIYGSMTSIYNTCDRKDRDCTSGAQNGEYYNNTLITSGSDWATCFSNVGGFGINVPSYKEFGNNICLHGASQGPIFEDNGTSVNIVNDYNLYYNFNSASSQIVWKGTYYSDFPIYSSYSGQDPNGISGNPNLNSNYSLSSLSPAIDAGLSLSIITRDIENVVVPQGSGTDIGAFEYQE